MTDQDEKKGVGFQLDSPERKRRKLEDRLTHHLLQKFTHEELARSTARLTLERGDLRKASIDAASEIAREVATHAAVNATNVAISAWKSEAKRGRREIFANTLLPIAARKKAAMDRAIEIAVDLWSKDGERQMRIGKMALKVYQELLGTEHKESLPSSDEQLREWIRGVAPDYATKGGRPRTGNHPDR